MATDRPATRDFVEATLGDLAEATDRAAMLRETLREFLTRRRSYAATADAMNLHRNSVQYRVQQATELLPEDTRDLGDDLNLRAALAAAHWLGDAALQRPAQVSPAG
jgi:DNA-binding PucR family transcriptional regulator